MRGKKGREDRAFDENDHAICVASTLFASPAKDGRRAKRKPHPLWAGLVVRCAERQEQTDSRDTLHQEHLTAFRAASNYPDPTYSPCNVASQRDGSTQAGAPLQSYSTRIAERQSGGQRRPATEWKAAYAITVLNHLSVCNRKKCAELPTDPAFSSSREGWVSRASEG